MGLIKIPNKMIMIIILGWNNSFSKLINKGPCGWRNLIKCKLKFKKLKIKKWEKDIKYKLKTTNYN